MELPKMHYQTEFDVRQLEAGFLSDAELFSWFHDRYSTSKHLLTLYGAVIGLDAKKVLEVGFGRSTPVLASALRKTGGRLFSCDTQNFSHMLSDEEKSVVTLLNHDSSALWALPELGGLDMAFLDYFSGEHLSFTFCLKEINRCLSLMKTNGLIFVHDTFDERYQAKLAMVLLKWMPGIELVTFPYNYGLTCIRKIKNSPYGSTENIHYKKN